MTDIQAFSLFDLWAVCVAHSKVFVATVLVFVFFFAAYAMIATPTYRAEVVMIQTEDISASGLTSGLSSIAGLGILAGLGSADNASVKAIATLKSRVFLRRFVEIRNLTSILFEDLWDKKKNAWKADIESVDIPTVADAVEAFRGNILFIDDSPVTRLTTLAIEWKNPRLAAKWANELVVDVNAILQAREIAEAESIIAYLYDELEKTNVVELQQVIYGLLEQQINRITIARVRTEFAFQVIDPAVSPELDSYVYPQRLLLVFTGVVGGLLAGCLVTLMLNYARSKPRNT